MLGRVPRKVEARYVVTRNVKTIVSLLNYILLTHPRLTNKFISFSSDNSIVAIRITHLSERSREYAMKQVAVI